MTCWPTQLTNVRHSIGRITRGLLISISQITDVIEPIAKFTAELSGEDGVGMIWNVGLEEWEPGLAPSNHPKPPPDAPDDSPPKYDLVWVQWCVGHLKDLELVSFLERCKGALTEDGLIVVKENLSTSNEDLFDSVDSSVTR